MGQDRGRITQVRVDDRSTVTRGQGLRVSQHRRVVVHVNDPGVRRDCLGDLVHVPVGGQPGAEVEELPDARLGGQEPDRAAEERPVGPGHLGELGGHFHHLAGGSPVGGEVVLPAEQVVIDPGRGRDRRVDPRGHLVIRHVRPLTS